MLTVVLFAEMVEGPLIRAPFCKIEYLSNDAGALVDFHVHVGAASTPPCVPAHEKAVNSRTGGSLPIVAVRAVFGY